MNRAVHVVFVNKKIEDAFEGLKVGKFEDKKLYKSISRAINDLKQDPTCGIHIPKRLVPDEYVQKFSVTNLRKYNLPNAWRLLYTIKGDDIQIISIILEWIDHKDYERKFKY